MTKHHVIRDFSRINGDFMRDERRACNGADTDLFFTDSGVNQDFARRLCRSCPVRRECIRFALKTKQEFGIWGGVLMSSADEVAQIKGRGTGCTVVDTEVLELWKTGMSDRKIAAALGAKRDAIVRSRRRLNLEAHYAFFGSHAAVAA